MNYTKPVIWSTEDLETVFKQKISFKIAATGISIDSRTVEPGDIFIAIKGEHMDGHVFVEAAIKKGAVAAIICKGSSEISGLPCIHVPDTMDALYDMAVFQRERVKARYVAVTGSVGKTSTKEMLASALRKFGRTYMTYGNLNNHIGVPLCLCRMPLDTEFAVYEIGMNHAGEITPLAELVRPEVAVISNIAAVHLEFFDSVQAIADAKSEIFAGVPKTGTVVLNADNSFFHYLEQKAAEYHLTHIIGFGKTATAKARLLSYKPQVEGGIVTADISGQRVEYPIGISGEHQALNSVGVLQVVATLGNSVEKAATAFSTFTGTAGRGKRHTVTIAGNRTINIIDDTYNASPVSVDAALKVLGYAKGRKVAILGDMFELGESAPQLHKQLWESLVANHIDAVFLTGALMKHLYDALPKTILSSYASDKESLYKILDASLKDGDTVMIKGSHGMKMEQVVQYLVDCS
jgi:UDP-N-acetylmuramoyl-tripeptide--D-alanyl-D-alanine ligase